MRQSSATPEAYQLFHEGTLELSRVEANGMMVDVDYLNKQKEEVSKSIKEKKDQLKDDEVFSVWRREFGQKTKLNSAQQLEHVLFDVLGYEAKSQTAKGGRRQTGEEALRDIDLPFVRNYIALKKLEKVQSTYIGGLLREVDSHGFIHPFFNLAGGGKTDDDEDAGGPASYRSASNSPNAQNFIKRDKERAKMVRRSFISRFGDDGVIAEIDYKGIEVGMNANYSEDPVLIDYVTNSPPKDMHRDQAVKCFLIEESEVNRLSRDISKNQLVFPLFYGSYYIDCAKALWEDMQRLKLKVGESDKLIIDHLKTKGIRKLGECVQEHRPVKGTYEHHISKVQNDFWDLFGKHDEWRKKVYRDYQKNGYILTKTGFICTFSARGRTLSRNDASNYPVQGSAFHCLLWSLIRLQRWMRKMKMVSVIIAQVHDSIVFDCLASEWPAIAAKAAKIMEVDLPKHYPWIVVPMKVDMEMSAKGGNWFEKTEYKVAA